MEFYAAEIEGEILLIGMVAILGAFFYYKLDLMMQLMAKNNELLEKLIEKKDKDNKEK
jgi:hypothetical protein